MRKVVFLLLGVSLMLSGCATEPFKPGRPIKPGGSFFSRSFTQDDKTVGMDDLFFQLKQNEDTKASAMAGQQWYYSSMVPSVVGGYLIGYNLASNSNSKSSGLLISAGLIGVALLAAYCADQNLMESVGIYNRKIAKKTSATFSLQPLFGMTQAQTCQSSSCATAVVGLSASY